MDTIDLQNRILRYTVIVLLLLVIIIGTVAGFYITDTRDLRREMLDYARESIRFEYEKLRDDIDRNIESGNEELNQLEKLIDDYNSNSMELDDLLNGMEDGISKIRERS